MRSVVAVAILAVVVAAPTGAILGGYVGGPASGFAAASPSAGRAGTDSTPATTVPTFPSATGAARPYPTTAPSAPETPSPALHAGQSSVPVVGVGGEASLLGGGQAADFVGETASTAARYSVAASSIYPPDLRLLGARPSSPSQILSPGYLTSPAPMGLADLGLGAANSTYSVHAADVLGTVQLNGYNATAGSLYEDTGAYYWDGGNPYADPTPWQSDLELNSVITNISYPGANNGSFWTQNVVDFRGSELQLVDNLWNASNPYLFLGPGTLYSYDGVFAYPEFYYDDGPTFPIAYPMTIQLYNNATLVDGRSAVTFGYRIAEPGRVYTGVYDEVVFNSTPNASTPLLTPDFLVSGTNSTPSGLLYDAELVFGGPGDGSNAVVTALNGSEAIAYRTGAGWLSAPSTYDYGVDTAETSIGIAGWYDGTTEFVNQGPSILYGLWNSTGGVPSGDIGVHLALTPDYQFIFIGTNGTDVSNESFAPTTASGELQTWLPPGAYNISGWADGFDTGLGQFDTSVDGSFELTPDPAVWNAPVYLNGPSQATTFAVDAVGWAGVGPIRVINRTVNVSLVFNHLNDYGYTEFSLLWAFGFSAPRLYVSNVTQGPDLGTETIYLGDTATAGYNLPDLGSALEAWDVPAPEFSNLSLYGLDLTGTEEGGAVAVWNAPAATAYRVDSTNGSLGFWAANSADVVDTDSNATNDAFAFSLMASQDGQGSGLVANLVAYAVLSEGSDDAAFESLQSLGESIGYTGFASNGTQFTDVVAHDGGTGVDLQGDSGVRIEGLDASASALGVFGSSTTTVSISSMDVRTATGEYQTFGAVFYGANWTTISGLTANDSVGVEFLGGANESVSDIDATNNSIAIWLIQTDAAQVSGLVANNAIGVFIEFNQALVSVRNVNAVDSGIGIISFLTDGVSYSQIVANGSASTGFATYGVTVDYATNTSVEGVVSEFGAIGVNVSQSANTTVGSLTVQNGATGVSADEADGLYVSSGTAYGSSSDVVAHHSTDLVLSHLAADDADAVVLRHVASLGLDDTTATNGGVALLGLYVTLARLNETRAGNASLGISLVDSSQVWINATTATNGSIAVDLELCDQVWVTGVQATDPGPSAFSLYGAFDLPTAAVVTEETRRVTISAVRAASYPAALYDRGSDDLVASGLNASNGAFGALLNGTADGLLYGLSFASDGLGLVLEGDATQNVVTGSRFVADAGYGVEIESGSGNLVYYNSFSGDNGADATYSAAHIQAFTASDANAFNDTTGVGNYWSDWHEYVDGVLAPYFVGSGRFDQHPLGAPEGTELVTVTETGLPTGTPWSATVGGATYTSKTPTLEAFEPAGSYAFDIAPVAGYSVAPANGTLTVLDDPVTISVAFAPLYPVTFVASGLPADTAWTVYLNGVEHSSSGDQIGFNVTAGTYGYTVVLPVGWTTPDASGTITLGGPYVVPVSCTSTAAALTTVTVEENGLAELDWTVIFGGVAHAATGPSVTFSVPSGTYVYQVEPVSGYSADHPSGTLTVTGSTYLVWVTFTPVTYSVTFSATGLAAGTVWSVDVAGSLHSTASASITLALPNGTFTYTFESVDGYTLSETTSTGTVTVAGSSAAASGAYAPSATSNYVPTPTFEEGSLLVLAVAVVALGLAVATLLRGRNGRRRPPSSSAPPDPDATDTATRR